MATACQDDTQLRIDELVAMESIYGHDGVFSCDRDAMKGFISVSPEVDQPVRVIPRFEDEREVEIRFFPPVTVEFHLPPEYPSSSPPRICVVSNWLSPVQMLKVWSHLHTLWKSDQGYGVLFEYAEFLRSSLLSMVVGSGEGARLDVSCLLRRRGCAGRSRPTIAPTGAVRSRYRLTLPPGTDVRLALTRYQQECELRVFQEGRFSCGVCGEEVSGRLCLRLTQCAHVFCRQCLSQYYSLLISEGNVHGVQCPEVQCRLQPLPSEVCELVGEDLFQRYDSFLLSSTLRSMTDVVLCPRLHCQSTVLLEEEENMGRCANCDFVFCSLCKRAYHGENPCSIDKEKREALVKAYLAADQAEKSRLESVYGRKQLVNMVEETQSQQWMLSNSVTCPKCNSPIEKVDGCNKMTCVKCGTLFCWLCRQRLPATSPYLHFNVPGTPCYNRLFFGVVDDLAAGEEDQYEDEEEYLSESELDGMIGAFL